MYDGLTGEAYNEKSVVGINYILKLSHMLKINLTLVLLVLILYYQQPWVVKRKWAVSEWEKGSWALEAHRAAHVLQEMLTIKSDDVRGRAKAFEAIVKGEEIPAPTVPESFKVLCKELNSLVLDIDPLDEVLQTNDEEKKDEAAEDILILEDLETEGEKQDDDEEVDIEKEETEELDLEEEDVDEDELDADEDLATEAVVGENEKIEIED
jgi:DNA-directed RNA polymerase subunit beta